MQQENCALFEGPDEAACAVAQAVARERDALLKRKASVYQALAKGEATWDDAEAVEAEWAALEGRRQEIEADAKAEIARAAKRAVRVRQNERLRKFVGSYIAPGCIRHLPLSFQAVYLAISKACCATGHTELANGQIEGMTGLSKATVKRATARLVDLGAIVKTIRKVRHVNRPNLYRLASEKLLAWARKIFGRGRLTREPQLKTGFNPVTTRAQKTAKIEETEGPKKGRPIASSVNVQPVAEDGELREAFERLAKLALDELGKPLTTHAGPSAVTQAVDRIKKERIAHFHEAEWQRFRKVHGRKADLALLETVMLEDIRDGTIASTRPQAQRIQIKNPARYLHGILARRRDECRPHVTLGRLLTSRKRTIPPVIEDAIEDYASTRRSRKAFLEEAYA